MKTLNTFGFDINNPFYKMDVECSKARDNLRIGVHITRITFFYDMYRTIRYSVIVKLHLSDYA